MNETFGLFSEFGAFAPIPKPEIAKKKNRKPKQDAEINSNPFEH
jgi:hypothetical protein